MGTESTKKYLLITQEKMVFLPVDLKHLIRRFFFQDLRTNLSQIVNKYENIFIAGDRNIDIAGSTSGVMERGC